MMSSSNSQSAPLPNEYTTQLLPLLMPQTTSTSTNHKPQAPHRWPLGYNHLQDS